MNILTRVAAAFAVFATEALAVVKADGIELAGRVAVDVEDEFEKLVDQLGAPATKFVTALFGPDGTVDGVELSGLEKANLATTQLVEHAAQSGIVLAGQHATSLIQSAYLAVKDQIAKL